MWYNDGRTDRWSTFSFRTSIFPLELQFSRPLTCWLLREKAPPSGWSWSLLLHSASESVLDVSPLTDPWDTWTSWVGCFSSEHRLWLEVVESLRFLRPKSDTSKPTLVSNAPESSCWCWKGLLLRLDGPESNRPLKVEPAGIFSEVGVSELHLEGCEVPLSSDRWQWDRTGWIRRDPSSFTRGSRTSTMPESEPDNKKMGRVKTNSIHELGDLKTKFDLSLKSTYLLTSVSKKMYFYPQHPLLFSKTFCSYFR